jgi:hypothetical protein
MSDALSFEIGTDRLALCRVYGVRARRTRISAIRCNSSGVGLRPLLSPYVTFLVKPAALPKAARLRPDLATASRKRASHSARLTCGSSDTLPNLRWRNRMVTDVAASFYALTGSRSSLAILDPISTVLRGVCGVELARPSLGRPRRPFVVLPAVPNPTVLAVSYRRRRREGVSSV